MFLLPCYLALDASQIDLYWKGLEWPQPQVLWVCVGKGLHKNRLRSLQRWLEVCADLISTGWCIDLTHLILDQDSSDPTGNNFQGPVSI